MQTVLRHIPKRIFLFLVTTGIMIQAAAQLHMTNTGILKVSGATDTLYVSNNYTNTSAATFTNNGILLVKGTLSNAESGMNAGTGTLYLNGSSAQSVTGTATFKTYNFVSANSAGITLNNDLSVSGAHTFSAGIIQSSATPNYLIYEAGSSYTGDGDTRHVNGWVKKIGTTAFTFPVGNGTYERTAAIASLSASAEIDCHYYYTGTQNLYNLNAPLIAVDSNEYWTLNRISGGNFKVNLNWNNSKVQFYNVLLADVLVAEYQGGLWRSLGGSASGSVATTGTVNGSVNALTSNSNYTFGFTTYPLSVNLVSFTGSRQGQVNILQWTAEQELLAGNYEIQRSSNGQQFITAGSVAAANSGNREYYTYRDPVQSGGVLYYRLKMQDAGGKTSFSNVIRLSDNGGNGSFSIPNPVRDNITIISHAGVSGDFAYALYNAGGQRIRTGMTTIPAGGQTSIALPAGITSGIYTIELRNTQTSFRQQLLVKQ